MLGRLLKKIFGQANSELAAKPGEAAANEQVRQMLRKHGDDGSAIRPIDHFAYPSRSGGAAEAGAVESALKQFGFAVKPAVHDGGLTAQRESAVSAGEFDLFTARVAAALGELGWDYDGWGCPVVTRKEKS